MPADLLQADSVFHAWVLPSKMCISLGQALHQTAWYILLATLQAAAALLQHVRPERCEGRGWRGLKPVCA